MKFWPFRYKFLIKYLTRVKIEFCASNSVKLTSFCSEGFYQRQATDYLSSKREEPFLVKIHVVIFDICSDAIYKAACLIVDVQIGTQRECVEPLVTA